MSCPVSNNLSMPSCRTWVYAVELLERALAETLEHGVGHVADPGLERQQVARQPSTRPFVFKEVDDRSGDPPGYVVSGRHEACGVIWGVGLHDRHDLAGGTEQVRYTDPVARCGERDPARAVAAVPFRSRCRAYRQVRCSAAR